MASKTVEKAARGVGGAMKKLYGSYGGRVYYLCDRMLGSEAAASAAAAHAFENTWRAVKNLRNYTEEAFVSLLAGAAAAACRKAAAQPGAGPADSGPLARLFEGLPEKQRLAVLLKYLFNLEIRAVASAMQCDSGAAKNALKLAEDSLRRRLPELGAAGEGLSFSTLRAAVIEAAGAGKRAGADAAASDAIKAASVGFLRRNKAAVILVCCLALVVAGAVTAVILFGGSDGTTDAGTTESPAPAETSAEPQAYEAPALPEGDELHHVVIDIQDYGTISVELDATAAPVTVENFLKLAGEGFYDGLTFHRIIDGFMMQGGAPGGGSSPGTITGEFPDNGWDNPLTHVRGAIAMARSDDYNSASSQFFIVQQDSTYLDPEYAAFGYVTEGMDIVDRICADTPVTDGNGTVEKADQPVIASVRVVD